jgi:hypothetical protein
LTGLQEHPTTEEDPKVDGTSSADVEDPDWLVMGVEVEA